MTNVSAPQVGTWRNVSWKWTLPICAALLILFAVLSFTAAMTKSATYDEPLHVVGGFVHRHFNDYRVNFEDPALFGLWASLPLPNAALYVDTRLPFWSAIPGNTDQQWPFVIYTLYRISENWADDTLAIVRSQFMLIGVALGALTAWWSWRLAGGIAAIATTIFFALDPNITAHASLVKNDVATGLLLLALGYSMWQFGRRASLWRFAIVALVCGAAVNTKFSGVLFGPIALILLIARASISREPWRVVGISLKNIWDRVAAVLVMTVLIAAVVWGMTWAVYGFRFAPMRDAALFDMEFRMQFARAQELRAGFAKREGKVRQPTQAEFDAHKGGVTPRFAMSLDKHRILPQAWLFGFMYTYSMTLVRSSFLLGESRVTGWLMYFPLAMLFKTPFVTLLAMAGGLTLSLLRAFSPKMKQLQASAPANNVPKLDVWTILCLTVPPGVYLIAAMLNNLNLGLRHVLPVYPFIFIGIGVMISVALQILPKWSKFTAAGLVFLLAIESLASWPNYIPFFNTPSRMYGRMELLGDSNLDWGQDLKALGEWYKTHKDRPLYLSYFGMADPAYYGIQYTNVTAGWQLAPTVKLSDLTAPGYLAVSATNLQGIYNQRSDFEKYREQKPLAVIGGTIYIYEFTPTPASPATTPAK